MLESDVLAGILVRSAWLYSPPSQTRCRPNLGPLKKYSSSLARRPLLVAGVLALRRGSCGMAVSNERQVAEG